MGLYKCSTGAAAIYGWLNIKKRCSSDKIIALAGNPNVGKSTIFNGLTGLRQHTGNWPGKTVAVAQGWCEFGGQGFVVVDLPGCYSLAAISEEERVARDFILSGGADAIIAVCDATCLERSLAFALQVMEVCPNVVVCVNLMDEAEKKGIFIDLGLLSSRLGVPVVGTSARSRVGLDTLMNRTGSVTDCPCPDRAEIQYPAYIEYGLSSLEPQLKCAAAARAEALRLLEHSVGCAEALPAEATHALEAFNDSLEQNGISRQTLGDDIASAAVLTAGQLCRGVQSRPKGVFRRDRVADRVLAGRYTAFPIMFAGLLAILWLTIVGANYPSGALADLLFSFEPRLLALLDWLNAPEILTQMLVFGVYRTLAWVVSVMLPPMAIFFPLFTLLEDIGYLPRVAFNLDKCFKKCHACGKQALTMW